MASKLHFQVKAEKLDIKAVWSALTKNHEEFLKKGFPDQQIDAQVLECGDNNGNLCAGSIISATLRPGEGLSDQVEFYKEKIVEFDEENYFLSFVGLEGFFLERLDNYTFSIKLGYEEEEKEDGNNTVIISATMTYQLKKNFDGTQLMEGITKLSYHYLNGIVNYAHKNDT